MEPKTPEYESAVRDIARSRERVETILADPERVRLLTYESNGAKPMTAEEFREKYGIKAKP